MRPGVSVRSLSRAAVTAQIARAAMTKTLCRAIAVQWRTWGLIQAQAQAFTSPCLLEFWVTLG